MFEITYDGGNLLYDPRLPEYGIADASVSVEDNTAGSAQLTLYPTHPKYNSLSRMSSLVEVSESGSVIFRGRLVGENINLFKAKTLSFEGVLAFFNDTVIRPFNYPDDFADEPDYQAAESSGNVVEYFLSWLVGEHNRQATTAQQLILGSVTVADANNYIVRSSEDYATTWATISDKLINSALGGHLVIRYESDGNYVDYLSEFTLTTPQDIVLGSNIIDLSDERDGTATYSAILPLGTKTDENGESAARLTISELPDGELTSDLVKDGDTIYSRSALARVGKIYMPIKDTTWDDVTLAYNLQQKAMATLAGAVNDYQTITVTVADLHFYDASKPMFRVCRKSNVKSDAHGIDDSYDLTKITYNVTSPEQTRLTLGHTGRTLTSVTGSDSRDTDRQIEGVKTDIKGSATAISHRMTEMSTELVQSAHEIIIGALEEYTLTSDFEEFKQTLQTTLSVMSDQIIINFQAATDQISAVDGELQRIYNEQLSYIRFINGNIVMGRVGNEIILTLQNDRVSFTQNGLEVAYFANNKLYVTSAEFTRTLMIYNFGYTIERNGSLTFGKLR